jgi:hypothetical protein
MPYKDQDKQREAWRRYYYRNKDKIRAKQNKKECFKRNRKYVDELRSSTPCTDCKQIYPAICMDFDHISDDKSFDICYMVCNSYSLERIKLEIAKCEVVCSNCHRIRTRDRKLAVSNMVAGPR